LPAVALSAAAVCEELLSLTATVAPVAFSKGGMRHVFTASPKEPPYEASTSSSARTAVVANAVKLSAIAIV
jgi:hypothetical protein